MENSIFLAKLIGPYCIIVAVGIMFNLEAYQKVMQDFFKNSALIYLGGVLALIIGLLIVLSHNLWIANWPIIITLFGWLGIIKGAWLIILPDVVANFADVYRKKTTLLRAHLIVVLALGICLTIFGYFSGQASGRYMAM